MSVKLLCQNELGYMKRKLQVLLFLWVLGMNGNDNWDENFQMSWLEEVWSFFRLYGKDCLKSA